MGLKASSIISLIALSFLLGGCATGTRHLNLTVDDFPNDKTTSGKIAIATITDSRQFEDKPKSPSTPSVDGTLSETSKEKLATLIGRQRNGYGMALGDIALPEGQTVQDEVRSLLRTGLESRGYTVVEDGAAPVTVNVDIERFWAWFSPGFASVGFESQIQTNLQFRDEGLVKQVLVSAYGINRGQYASNANWELAFKRAMNNYLEELDKALDSEGL